MGERRPLLAAHGLSKRFGATQALDRVDFELRSGEVHALMGENGAGKSTLMKIVSGNYPPDAGEILLEGRPLVMASPRDAMTAGIGIIHQELNTFPEMTVAENLAIGREPSRLGVLDRRRLLREAAEKLERVGADIDPRERVGALSVGMQQMVEIARAVAEDVKVLVLDEPTAALSAQESEHLFALVREMRASGMGLIYISHRMEEVWELSDRVTVLRDGKYVGTRDMSPDAPEGATPGEIVRMMVGREVEDLYVRSRRSIGRVRAEVENLTDGAGIGPVSFEIRSGEVVSMVGLIGAGRTEVGRLIMGADRKAGGTVRIDGGEVECANPRDGIRHGMGMLPESRKDQALFLEMSVRDNTVISTLRENSHMGVLDLGCIRKVVGDKFAELNVRTASQHAKARSLSGGNQQKLVLARLLLERPSLMILDEPTRGVDIGAKSEIYRIIFEAAAAGTAVLVISSDLPEALGISDRLLVMREGRIVAELDGAEASEERVMEHATGVHDSQ
ncbi:sugar ABC transporter ATP-binding protein [Schaalia sp. 19OD2882]|uniref:sugar ABC transporter ATP-binding protein n=1 Tax=Schaalia sp. 19OD2882 TaxID=2794089 RepID=UPI001C1F1BE0|nr:sugar ABC transporter ATP-binding protein [Schaalia sp. 19OD2882]QWW20447.1 sugar ABC transporter ATP-binding protein [Schaalia sp. 19OD2882]